MENNAFWGDLAWDKLPAILQYDPSAPMLFSSGLFFFLFIGFLLIYIPLRKHTLARIIYVTLFSLYFYYKSSGLYFGLLVFTATSDFIIAQLMSRTEKPVGRKMWVTLSLCVNLGMLAYFKYTNFLLDIGTSFLHSVGVWFNYAPWAELPKTEMEIFLPVGISFFTFQSISYIIDVYRGRIEPLGRWIDYVFYVSFFPQLVAGPIVRARDFIPQIYKNPSVSKAEFGEGLFLILCGLLKKCVISDYISLNFVDRVFDAPLLYTGVENLLAVYGYTLQIYCDFSGYSDMAIGLALLLGYRFNLNFDSPYQSATITEFWRRWHISLSTWFKEYLYIPLGGNRISKYRTYLNLFIVFLATGIWHGAEWTFVIWGLWHGAFIIFERITNLHKRIGGIISSILRHCYTILAFVIGWVIFRSDNITYATDYIKNMFGLIPYKEIYSLPYYIDTTQIIIFITAIMLSMPIFSNFLNDDKDTKATSFQNLWLLILFGLSWASISAGTYNPFIYFRF